MVHRESSSTSRSEEGGDESNEGGDANVRRGARGGGMRSGDKANGLGDVSVAKGLCAGVTRAGRRDKEAPRTSGGEGEEGVLAGETKESPGRAVV